MIRQAVPVDVFWAQVTPETTPGFTQSLSLAEKARMARFHFGHDRAAFATAHGLLRLALGRYLSAPYAGDFILGKHGKPELPGALRLRFNLSHSRGIVVAAVSPKLEVGIDVEPLSRQIDGRQLAANVLSQDESADLAATGRRSEDFLPRWVMKEALAKATGQGLQADFRQISLGGNPLGILHLPKDFGPKDGWSTDTRVIEGHIATAAACHPDVGWRWHRVTDAPSVRLVEITPHKPLEG